MVVLLLNGIAIASAAATGNLPNWPPGQADIHVAEQAGTPILHRRRRASFEARMSIWNDISISIRSSRCGS